MKTPFGSAAQGAKKPLSPPATKRPPVLGEGNSFNLGATRHLHAPSPSHRSSPGAATTRLLMRTGRRNPYQDLDALPMQLTPAAAARHQQKLCKPFGYSIKAAGALRPVCSPVIACIAGSPPTTTPPSTERLSLQAAVPCTRDLAAREMA